MCGIAGYIGHRGASAVLLDCLKRLEYRGYDSAGICVAQNELSVAKQVGEIRCLEEAMPDLAGTSGIGHTRWATHGGVTQENAHPHVSCNRDVAIVHNGIIENFASLRDELRENGHVFTSDTDSEVIAHLVEDAYDGSLEEAVRAAISRLQGSYAIVAVARQEPDAVVAVRHESPLVVGVGDSENFVSSDVPAFLEYTNRVIYLEDDEVCMLRRDSVAISDADGAPVEKDVQTVDWSVEDAEKGGYPHFMLKEIHEQPASIADTLRGRIGEIDPLIDLDGLPVDDVEDVTIVACGTSYYAGMVGKYLLEQLTGLPVATALSSEYRYYGPKHGLVVAVSQSGETADTLGAVQAARREGCRTLAVTNVEGSSITRAADASLLTRCGPEIGVAATKTFTAQVATLMLLGLYTGLEQGALTEDEMHDYAAQLRDVPAVVEQVVENSQVDRVAAWLQDHDSVFFIGRGCDYPLALEGALKLKEISYIHAEGFAAGELKHGPFALLTGETPVVAIATPGLVYDKMIANIGEIKARDAPVVAIAPDDDEEIDKYADHVIRYPASPEIVGCFPVAVILQLLAYHVARRRGCSIDKPRNLAKSVTVE
ncbi:MAG: glutamine--fructose-6-phosphate transaminase (isomerizing) [Thermoplasmatota archaeon]